MRITSAAVRDALMQSLADEYCRRIILNTMGKAQSVEELSQSQNIPIATAYRRVNEMNEIGILAIEKTILTEDGRKYPLYRSSFSSINIGLRQTEISVEVEFNEDVATRLARLWVAMRA